MNIVCDGNIDASVVNGPGLLQVTIKITDEGDKGMYSYMSDETNDYPITVNNVAPLIDEVDGSGPVDECGIVTVNRYLGWLVVDA